ncbi:MAG: hypothetical protein ACO24Y_12720 [Hylemonella sp.]
MSPLRCLMSGLLMLALSVQGVAFASQAVCHARTSAPVQQASAQPEHHQHQEQHPHAHPIAQEQHPHHTALAPDLGAQPGCAGDAGCDELSIDNASCVHHCAGFALHAWVPLDFALPLAKPVWGGALPSLHGSATPRGLERPPRHLPA